MKTISIERLEEELQRLKASQSMIHEVNAALQQGDDEALRVLGFSREHIADLKKKMTKGKGKPCFPRYAFRNNNDNIRTLTKLIQQVKHETSLQQK